MSKLDIRYNDDNTILMAVKNVNTITILSTAKIIYGSSETDYAFKGVSNILESFSFEENPALEKVSDFSFYECSKLTTADFSKCSHLTYIGKKAFSYCTLLSTVNFPTSLTNIEEEAFSNANIKKLYIPKNVKKLGIKAFGSNKELTSVEFHTDICLETIGSHLFYGCSALPSITLPKTMNGIAGNMFDGCGSLNNIFVQQGSEYYYSDNGVLMNKGKTALIAMPPFRSEPYSVPQGIQRINSGAFIGSRIKDVTFPTSLKYITSWAFEGSMIAELNLPGNVLEIGNVAFAYCPNLVSITFVDGLQSIGASCFQGCQNLKKIVLPSTLTSLGGGAFKQCHADLVISFDQNSDYILTEDNFITNKEGTEIVQYIGTEKTVTIEDKVEKILTKAFYISGVTTVNFGSAPKVREIGDFAFYQCFDLKSFTLPLTVQLIGESAFEECNSLSSVTFGALLQMLKFRAFKNCKVLTTVTFDKSAPITLIGYEAFYYCTALDNIQLPDNLGEIERDAFNNCGNFGELTIPSTVNKIGNSAFAHTGITSCTFSKPSLLTSISQTLFYNCTKLAHIDFPNQVDSIGFKAFAYTALTNVVLPASVTSIGEYSFQGCKQLTKFGIPQGSLLTNWSYGIFSQCTLLSEIACDSDNFQLDQTALYNSDKSKFLILPPASPVKYFSFPETVTTVGPGALLDCMNIEVIFIPGTMESIEISAFEGCINLKNINIPKSVTKIEKDAFKGCAKLTCDISIENRDSSFIEMLKTAGMQEKCFHPCNCKTLTTSNYRVSKLFLFSILLLN